MVHLNHSEQGDGNGHNKVFSSWSPEELYELCSSVAKGTCEAYGYSGESEDITQELCLYLWEMGHVIKCPEHKGVLYKYLRRCVKTRFRGRRNLDNKNISVDCNGPGEPELLSDYKAAETILKDIAIKELLAWIWRQASDHQKKIIEGLWDGDTQADIAKRIGCEQYQISRQVKLIRQRNS